MNEVILYGTPLSLYTGRARSYLIKADLPYREITPTTPHYKNVVLPAAGQSGSIPVIEAADGTVVRDGAAIVDYFESMGDGGFSPRAPLQNVVSRLFDVIGAEGLLRPAMHYRWDFPDENAAFVRFHFETMIPAHLDRVALAARTMDRMRGAGQGFGAIPENFAVIESLYEGLLETLDAHFSDYPYLLGGRPCIGDFGMIAPLYAHLGRDPKPLRLMQERAIRVFRWVERMNRPEPDIGEFERKDAAWLPDDRIPESLVAVLKHLAIDFVPETLAAADTINTWIETQEQIAPGTPMQRGVGMTTFELEGKTISAIAQPYRFYLLERVQRLYEAAGKADKAKIERLFDACSMTPVLTSKLRRSIGRENNLEVWL